MKVINVLGHSFIHSLLSDAHTILDCGANRGGFAQWASENTLATVYSFEPDARLFKDLPSQPRVKYFPYAIDGESGTMTLSLGEEHCSSAVYTENMKQQRIQVDKVCINDFVKSHSLDVIDLLKLDIEGSEISVLESMDDEQLSKIKQITVEFHDFLSPSDIPKIKFIVSKLRERGFYFTRFSTHTWGDCLFLNEHLVSVSRFQKINILLFGKYMPGMHRIIKRLLHSN